MAISSVVLYELRFGAENSDAPAKSLLKLEGFATRLPVFDFDEDAASHSAHIRADLSKRGCIIGTYDLTNRGTTEQLLDLRCWQQSFHRRTNVIDGVVDDVVQANFDVFGFRVTRCFARWPHVEADDDRLRRNGQVDVAFGDATDARMDDGDLDLRRRELRE